MTDIAFSLACVQVYGRRFIIEWKGLGSICPLSTASQSTPMIIDCHCHAGKGDLMTAPWNTEAAIEPYLRRAPATGIDKMVVVAPFHSDYRKANAQVAIIVARHQNRLIGFAVVHSTLDAGRILALVKHAVTRWGFRGMEVHGHDALPTREVCKAARTRHLCPSLWMSWAEFM